MENPEELFRAEVAGNIDSLQSDKDLQALSRIWIREITPHRYAYNFTWMGRPIIQFPQDMIAMQELIWSLRPDLLIETGIAHGGSIIYYASLMGLLGHGQVIGVDVDIRSHNRRAIEDHPMSKRIRLIEGSSIDQSTIQQITKAAHGKSALVVLDSNHTHDHVLSELRAYSPLVSIGSYCVVMDTIVQDMPKSLFPNRPWGPDNNPKTAVAAFLAENTSFASDDRIDAKLLISVAPSGYLRRIS